jgi:hypothetical protein
VSLERGPLSLVSTTEQLLGRNSSNSSLEIRKYGSGNLLRWPRNTLHPQKFELTSPTSGGRSIGIVHSRTKGTDFSFFFIHPLSHTSSWHRNNFTLSPPYNYQVITYKIINVVSTVYAILNYRELEKNTVNQFKGSILAFTLTD